MAENPKLRDVLSFLLMNSGGLLFERYDGKIALASLDDPGSVSRTIDDTEIKLDSSGVAKYDYNFTSANDLITRIDLKYQQILPLDAEFDKVKFAQRTGGTGEQNNFNFLDDDGNAGEFYSSLLQNAHNAIGEERPFTFEAEAIKDEQTAERLARLIILWRHKQLAVLKLHCTYKALDIEMWDDVGLSSTKLPSFLTTKRWKVVQSTPVPAIGRKDPGVKLSLWEIPLSDSAETVCEILTDTAGATILTDTAGAEPLQDTACN